MWDYYRENHYFFQSHVMFVVKKRFYSTKVNKGYTGAGNKLRSMQLPEPLSPKKSCVSLTRYHHEYFTAYF